MAGNGKSRVLLVAVLAFLAGAFVGNAVTMMYVSTKPAQQVSAPATSNQVDEHTAALAKLQSATATRPDDPVAWAALGNFHFDHDQPVQAVQAYEKALELDPSNADVWSDLGVMYRRSGEPEKAVQAFDTAATMDDDHTTAYFNKGIVLYYDLGKKDEAIAAWNRLLAMDPAAKAPNGMPITDFIKMAQEK